MKTIRQLLILSLIFFGVLAANAQALQYQRAEVINSKQGLSNTKVNDIVQDDRGYLWIATDDGLNRFDGYSFDIYRKIDKEPTSLFNSYVTELFFDSHNRLWIGTIWGLQYYCDKREQFVKPDLGLADSIFYGSYNWITEDSRGNLWFSIHNKGVVRYAMESGKSTFFESKESGGELGSSAVRQIVEDREGDIWFTSFDNGLTRYSPSSETFSYYNRTNSKLPTNAISRILPFEEQTMIVATLEKGVLIFNPTTGEVKETQLKASSFSMIELHDGSILIGTEGEGLYVADRRTGEIAPHTALSELDRDVVTSKMHCLYEDENNNIWVGMYNGGVATLRREPEGFYKFGRDYSSKNSLSYDLVLDILEEGDNIWFATDGGGLNRYNTKTGRYSQYKHNPNDPTSLPDDAVVAIFKDSKGTIWLGTYIGGFARLDKQTGSFTSYQYSGKESGLAGNYVKCFAEDSEGNLWLGLDGNGVSKFSPKSETFTNYFASSHQGLISDNVISIYLQDDKRLWVGTYTGISRFDIETGEFVSYRGESSVRDISVFSIIEDEESNLWFGTSSGLFLYNDQEDSFEAVELSSALQNVVVNGVVPYGGELWMSTNDGIMCYSPKEGAIKAMINNGDLGGMNFIKSSYHLSDSRIFFGGSGGCYAFYPDSIEIDRYTPKVYITGLRVFNDPVKVGKEYGGREILPEATYYTKRVELRYSENTFTIHFSTPTAKFPESYIYRCKLEGVDQQWLLFLPTQQSVTYANLPPGEYTFKVSASNISSEVSDELSSLQIVVLPPWWLTWWAKLGYVVLGVVVLSAILLVVYVRIRDRNRLYVEQLKAKKQEELNLNKIQFFTNVSHEFRTPLTLIISPLSELASKEREPQRAEMLQMMLRNANRLLRLINQILDLRKADNSQMRVEVQPIELWLFADSFLGLLRGVAEKRNITLELVCGERDKELVVWYDADLLEKCLYNLLFNALKYTPDGGRVALVIEQGREGEIELTVEDNGVGISPEELPFLFDRFYQGEFSKKTGTGVGLHLVKTIVELHGGEIEVESGLDEGSRFTITILEGNAHFEVNERNLEPWKPAESVAWTEGQSVEGGELDVEEIVGGEKPLLLLVEDESDMRMYINHELGRHYNITEAENGKEGLSVLKGIEPDLIISDVMMPEMDGIEFTRRVKEQIETCHIPVILLTANSEIEDQLRGLETGADSYIVKPFNVEYLKARVRNLLENRRVLQEKYRRFLEVEPEHIETTNPDEELLQNSITYIRTNIDNSELTVENMAKELGVSRTNLHKKVKTLTGKTPIELIRVIRMKQAAQLLKEGNLTVSEVAYMVGYNSLSYFSSSFNGYWGMSPTAYIEKNR